MKSPRKQKAAKAEKTSRAPKTHNLIDPKIRAQFLEMRDHWESLNSRATSAAGKRRQYEAEIKQAGFKMSQIKTSLLVATPEGEAELKARVADDLLAAAYSGSDIGEQLSLFLDAPRVPAVDRAYKEGQAAAMRNEAAVPKYDPSTDQHAAYMDGFHKEQERQVKKGITKLEGKAPKEGKKQSAKPSGRRGRPPGAKNKANGKVDEAPATRADVVAKAESDEPDSYFSRAAGTA